MQEGNAGEGEADDMKDSDSKDNMDDSKIAATKEDEDEDEEQKHNTKSENRDASNKVFRGDTMIHLKQGQQELLQTKHQ
jgi:hypothetical protein